MNRTVTFALIALAALAVLFTVRACSSASTERSAATTA